MPEQLADSGAGVGIVVDPLGDDVARPLQRCLGRGDDQFPSNAGALSRQESLSHHHWIEACLLAEHQLGEWLQASVSGDRSAGPPLRSERQIHVFER